MLDTFEIRIATPDDLPFLTQMLFEAVYWRPDAPRPGLDAGLANPEIANILAGWGRDGDLAVIAHESDQNLGAAWIRFWTEANHSYGFINESMPELGIGVAPEHRQQGIGRALVRALIRVAQQHDIQQISLSVEADNRARDLYRSEGFRTVGRVENADTMLFSSRDLNV